MKAVVTGGLGFLGSHLVEELLARGDEVTVLDDFSAGREANLAAVKGSGKLKIEKWDVRRSEGLGKKLAGADALVHLAAMVSVQRSVDEPGTVKDVNVRGTENVLQACREAGVRKVVFASSAAVYGRATPPVKETAALTPLSPYAATKIEGEALCRAFAETTGASATSLRFFNIYGPRATGGPYAGVIHSFAKALKERKPLVVYGDGKQTRDFVHVSDAVQAVVLALAKESRGEAYNVGTGRGTSVNDLAALFQRIGGKQEVRHEEGRRGEVRESYADLQKVKEAIGYFPKVILEDGVSDYISWFTKA